MSAASTADDLEQYLQDKGVTELFIRIVEKLLLDKPDNIHAYIISHLLDNFPEQTHGFTRRGDDSILSSPVRRPVDESMISAEDEVAANSAPPAVPAAPSVQARRGSISAAPLTAEEASRPPVTHDKTAEDALRLEAMLKDNWVTASLSGDQMACVVRAMDEVAFKQDEVVIEKGDFEANHYYVVKQGAARILDEGGVLLRECAEGDGFGELALLYNTPRCATVVAASSPLVCWRLDRITFKKCVIQAAMERREAHASFLASVPVLGHLSDKERLVLADAVQLVIFEPNQVVIKQGARGDAFFLVVKGRLSVHNDDTPIDSLGPGDYFGELALLEPDGTRACTVQAMDQVELLKVRREVFHRLLGSAVWNKQYKRAKQLKQQQQAKQKKKRGQQALEE